MQELSRAGRPLLAGDQRGVHDAVTVFLHVHGEDEFRDSRVQKVGGQSGREQFGHLLQQRGQTGKRATSVRELRLQPLDSLLFGEGEDDLGDALCHDVNGRQGDVAPLDLKYAL